MATITIKAVVPNIGTVIQYFDRIKVYRSTTGSTGVFTELTVPATRPVLEANKTIYEYVDTLGDNSYWYTTSFFNSTTLQESSQSLPAQGEGDPALDVLDIETLKTNYLFGVDMTDNFGCPFPDSFFEFYIKQAVTYAEHLLDLPIRTKIFSETEPERLDFYRQDYYKYIKLQVDEYPILSVESIKLVLPIEQQVINFDPSWWQVQKFSGQIEIVPGNGQMSVVTLGQTGAWLPLIYGWTDFIPHVFRVSYTAGFEKGKVPSDILHLIGMFASFGPLNVAGDLINGAGISSRELSIDGIFSKVSTTQSPTNAGFGARILMYQREIKQMIPIIRNYYKGVKLSVA